jgi:ribonuclease HII
MLLLGVDEAGKGPVIGSMFVAGLVIDQERLFDLAAIGVKDSKQLSSERRNIMSKKIERIADDRYILEVPPVVIDELRQIMTMNDIMVRCFAQVLQRLSFADRAILDAADVSETRFGERVRKASGTTMEIRSEHKADQNHPIVSAASILAKVKRDGSIRELEQSMNCTIGSGYPNDPQTIEFLSQWVKAHRDLPPCARQTWATAQRMKASFI